MLRTITSIKNHPIVTHGPKTKAEMMRGGMKHILVQLDHGIRFLSMDLYEVE